MSTQLIYREEQDSRQVVSGVEAMSPLFCEILTDFSRVEMLSADWDRLWKADKEGEIFSKLRLESRMVEGLPEQAETLLSCSEGRRACGRDPAAGPRWPNHARDGGPQSDYTDLLAEESAATRVLAAAVNELFHTPGWKECLFEHLAAQSRIVRHADKLPRELRECLSLAPARHSSTILLQNEAGVLHKLAAKKHLRRHESKLTKSGSLNFRFLETREEIWRHLPDFFQHQIRRRVLQAETSDCRSPEFSELLRGLVRELCPCDELRFGILEWNGQPLAYHIGFQVNDKFTMYQQAFDVDAWDYSPGEVLLRQLFLYAGNHVSREFDFSVGYEFYKSRFANHLKENFTLYLQRPNLNGRIRRLQRKSKGRLLKPMLKVKNAVRTTPAIFSKVRFVRQWAADLRARRGLREWRNGSRTSATATGQKDWRKYFVGDSADALKNETGLTDPRIQIIPARLSSFADLHLECPGFRLATRFSLFRERLRKQDKAYIVRFDGKLILLLWTRTEQPAKAAGSPEGCDDAAKALYDYTYLGQARNRPPYEAVLSFAIEYQII